MSVVQLKNELAEAAAAEMEQYALSQAVVARESGVNSSAFNRWLRGQYPGDNATIDDKIKRWLDARLERRRTEATLPAAPAWVDTPSARQVLSALSYAQMAGDITVIYGGCGIGTPLDARHYERLAPTRRVCSMAT